MTAAHLIPILTLKTQRLLKSLPTFEADNTRGFPNLTPADAILPGSH